MLRPADSLDEPAFVTEKFDKCIESACRMMVLPEEPASIIVVNISFPARFILLLITRLL